MLIRVRSNVGVWRVDGLDEATATVEDVLQGIAATRPHVVYEKPLSMDPACQSPLDKNQPLSSQRLRHGSMIHCRVDPSTTADHTVVAAGDGAAEGEAEGGGDVRTASAGNMKRVIGKDGSIQLVPADAADNPNNARGFRKGMLPLRDMKMAWTLNEFMEMDAQFTFKIQRQPEAFCAQVSLDSTAIGDFQSYLARFQFKRKRCAYLYGRFVNVEGDEGEPKKEQPKDDNPKSMSIEKMNLTEKKPRQRAIVEAIYEPPQDVDSEAAEGFVLLDDPMEDNVEQIAKMCGLTRVGWIFGHGPRSKEGMVMTAAEVVMAAELQLEAAGGIEDTPFVTVKVTSDESTGNVSVEAFQVSQQCMSIVAEEALEVDSDESVCRINETFTAIQEGKASKTVDNNFFLCVVPIAQHTSEMFVSQFPKLNRDLDDRTPSNDELKRQLSKSGKSGWTFVDLLADFNLLIYLSKLLDVNADMPKIAQSIVNREVPLDDGYKILIASMAGLDGSY